MKLEDFASLPEVAITIRGVTFTATALSAEQAHRLTQLFPAPTPPLVPDPRRGTLAPKVPDYTDVGFVQANEVWASARALHELIVAIGAEVDGQRFDMSMSDADARAVLVKLAEQMNRRFTTAELTRAWRRVREAGATVADADVPVTPADALAAVASVRARLDVLAAAVDVLNERAKTDSAT